MLTFNNWENLNKTNMIFVSHRSDLANKYINKYIKVHTMSNG